MLTNRKKVYVTRKLPDTVLEPLRQVADVSCYEEPDTPVPRATLLQQIVGVDAIISLLTERIDAEILHVAGPSLQIVANVAVGYDNIDVLDAIARNVVVTHTPGVLTETTADLTFALMLAAARRIPESEQILRAGAWRTWSPMMFTGQDVFGKTLGLVGMGRIGQAVARRARGFEMRIQYHSTTPKPELDACYGYTHKPLNTLLETSDFVVLLAPATSATYHMIGSAELARMKSNAILINTGRGSLVDEVALYDALVTGRIWAAGLDVYESEPIGPAHPFTKLQNVVLLPHIGSASIETRMAMARLAVESVLDVLEGRTPKHIVRQQQ